MVLYLAADRFWNSLGILGHHFSVEFQVTSGFTLDSPRIAAHGFGTLVIFTTQGIRADISSAWS